VAIVSDQPIPFGVVVNPAAALGRGERAARRVFRELHHLGVPAIRLAGTDAASCQEAIRQGSRSGLRGLILVGGDGLIGLTLQVPEARALPIGIVPAGSGNDFARQFDLQGGARRAVRRILAAESHPMSVDLGVVTRPGAHEHWFACGLSIGFDASINRRANRIQLPLGPLKYHAALLIELARLTSRPLTLTTRSTERSEDPETRSFTGLLATAMNTRTIGGGIPLAPGASTSDGELDLVQVAHGSKRRILSVLGVLARGRHERLPEVRITRFTHARIDAGAEIAYADGDEVGVGPFEIRVAPAAIRLLTTGASDPS